MLGATPLRGSWRTMASGVGAEAAAMTLEVRLSAPSKCVLHLSRETVKQLGRDTWRPWEESRETETGNQGQPRSRNKQGAQDWASRVALRFLAIQVNSETVNYVVLIIWKERVDLCFAWYLTIIKISQMSPYTGGNEQQTYQHAEISYLRWYFRRAGVTVFVRALKILLFLSF